MICTANTILYCRNWEQTLLFYRKTLKLRPLMEKEWFVEFDLGGNSRLSIADEKRSSIESSQGRGITLSLEIKDIEKMHRELDMAGAKPTPVRDHPWGARAFYLSDPEGHRIEFWEKKQL